MVPQQKKKRGMISPGRTSSQQIDLKNCSLDWAHPLWMIVEEKCGLDGNGREKKNNGNIATGQLSETCLNAQHVSLEYVLLTGPRRRQTMGYTTDLTHM